MGSHAALPSEVYWNSVLPNSPMPKAVKNFLYPTAGTHTLQVNKRAEDPPFRIYGSQGTESQPHDDHTHDGGRFKAYYGGGQGTESQPHDDHTHDAGRLIKPYYGGGQGTESQPHDDHTHDGGRFKAYYGAKGNDESQPHPDQNVAFFFLQEDLTAGKKKNLNFYKYENGTTFLPRKVADSIPFSYDKLAEIFSKFSVNPRSKEAETMKRTILECEDDTAVKGEEKFCATSLESMVDFSTSKIGKHVEAISTNVENGGKLKEYTIVGVKKMPRGDGAVVSCHTQAYVYAVFYCHKTETTQAYKVSMVADDGSKAEVAAVCHLDTTAWNPKYVAFQALNVKPGFVPVCHFLPADAILWVPKN